MDMIVQSFIRSSYGLKINLTKFKYLTFVNVKKEVASSKKKIPNEKIRFEW